MNQLELEKQQNRLRNWISMLAIFPNDSIEGRLRDELWKSKLEAELAELEKKLLRSQLNCLAWLSRVRNNLRGLR